MIHSRFMIYYLLKLVNNLTGTTQIEYERLEKAFYVYLDIIGKFFDKDIKYDFAQELDKLISDQSDIFILNDDAISIIDDDVALAYNYLTGNLTYNCLIQDDDNITYDDESESCSNDVADDDFAIGDFVADFDIIKALGIPVSISEYQKLFKLNDDIYDIYLKLANLGDDEDTIKYLETLVNSLEEKVSKLNIKDLTILEACFKLLNRELLDETENIFGKESWYIILFSTSKRARKILGYDKLEDLCLNLDEDEAFNNIDDEEDTEVELAHDISDEDTGLEQVDDMREVVYISDEETFFLTQFFIKLKDFVASLSNSILKQKLNIYLYKLLATRKFSDIEKYYLEEKTFQNFTLPSMSYENYDEETFKAFFGCAMECALSLDFSNEELAKDPWYTERTIIYCLFINTYLSLSQNETSKKEIINLLITSRFYKQKGYEEISSYIDNLIFNNNDPKRSKS